MSIATLSAQEIIIINHHYQRVKRLLDVAFTVAILLPLLLITLLIAVMITLDTPGPVFFVRNVSAKMDQSSIC